MSSTSTATPVGQPLHGASFGQAVKRFFQGYVKFSGRASRSEYWWAMLFSFIVSLVASIPYWIAFAGVMARTAEVRGTTSADGAALAQDLGAAAGTMLLGLGILFLVSLAFVLPTYAAMWRRLQDANFHGAFALLSLVGFGIVPLIMCALPSNPAGVQYDPAYRALHGGAYGGPPSAAAPYGQSTPYADPTPYAPPQPRGQHAAQPQAYGQLHPSGQPQGYSGMRYGGEPYSSAP